MAKDHTEMDFGESRFCVQHKEFSELTQEQKNLDLITKMNGFLAKLEIEVLQKSIARQVLFGQGVQLSDSQEDPYWEVCRKFRLTSSLFGKVAKKKKWENMSNFVFNNFFKTGDYICQMPAIKHGNEMEPKVFEIYSDIIQNSQVCSEIGRAHV